MKTTIFVASPRKKGNSNYIAKYFLKGLEAYQEKMKDKTFENKLIRLQDYKIIPCTGCGHCDETAKCILKDDMDKLYLEVEDSQLMIFITPVYFASVPAHFKAFIDRFQPYYTAKYLLKSPKIPRENNKKVILYVVSGYNKKIFFENIKTIMDIYCLNLNLDFYKSFHLDGIDGAGEILNKPKVLDEIESFGEKIQAELNL